MLENVAQLFRVPHAAWHKRIRVNVALRARRVEHWWRDCPLGPLANCYGAVRGQERGKVGTEILRDERDPEAKKHTDDSGKKNCAAERAIAAMAGGASPPPDDDRRLMFLRVHLERRFLGKLRGRVQYPGENAPDRLHLQFQTSTLHLIAKNGNSLQVPFQWTRVCEANCAQAGRGGGSGDRRMERSCRCGIASLD
jgi:hypothetical protein